MLKRLLIALSITFSLVGVNWALTSITAYKTFTREVLTSADLNQSFSRLVTGINALVAIHPGDSTVTVVGAHDTLSTKVTGKIVFNDPLVSKSSADSVLLHLANIQRVNADSLYIAGQPIAGFSFGVTAGQRARIAYLSADTLLPGIMVGALDANNQAITNVDINSGAIDGATIATSDVTVGADKTLDVSAGTLTLADDQILGDKISGGTIGTVTISQLAGALDANSQAITNVDINSGNIDGATIATSDVTVGSGKTLDVSAGTLTLADDQILGDKISGGTIGTVTISQLAGALDANSQAITNVDINSGNIDETIIGASNAAAGTFTTITGSDDVYITSADNLSPIVLIENTIDNANSASIDFYKNSTGVNTYDGLGTINFYGKNAAGTPEKTRYAYISSAGAVTTDDSESGQLDFQVMNGGSHISAIRVEPTEVVFNDNHANMNFRIEGDGEDDLFVVDASADKIGINTETPVAPLEIKGASQGAELGLLQLTNDPGGSTDAGTGTYIAFAPHHNGGETARISAIIDAASAGTAFAFSTHNNSAFAERVRITSAGNVGIGTSAPDLISNSNYPNVLTVFGSTTGNDRASLEIASRRSGAASEVGRLSFWNSEAAGNRLVAGILAETGESGTSYATERGQLGFYTTTTASSGGGVLTERMRINSNGRVGINMSTPGDYAATIEPKLVVYGGTLGGITIANSSTDGASYLSFADGTSAGHAFDGYIGYFHNTKDMAFGTNTGDGGFSDAVKMIITGGGDVGIGGTPASNVALHMERDLSDAHTTLKLQNTNATGGIGSQIQLHDHDSYWYQTIVDGDLRLFNGGEALTILANRNVGVGTTGPASQKSVGKVLHVSDSGSAGIVLEGPTGSAWEVYAMSDDIHIGRNTAADALVIDGGTNYVGLNTGNTAYPLTLYDEVQSTMYIKTEAAGDADIIFGTNIADAGNSNDVYARVGIDYSNAMSLKMNASGSMADNHLVVGQTGNVAIGGNNRDHQFEIVSGSTYSEIDAGESTFSVSSHSSFKENFIDIDEAAVVEAFMKMPAPRRYNFKRSMFDDPDWVASQDKRLTDKSMLPEINDQIAALKHARRDSSWKVTALDPLMIITPLDSIEVATSLDPSMVITPSDSIEVVTPLDSLLQITAGGDSIFTAQWDTTMVTQYTAMAAQWDTTMVAQWDSVMIYQDPMKVVIPEADSLAIVASIKAERLALHNKAMSDYNNRLDEATEQSKFGLMAEDFHVIAKMFKPDSDPTSLDIGQVVNALVIVVQNQNARIDALEKRVKDLEEK